MESIASSAGSQESRLAAVGFAVTLSLQVLLRVAVTTQLAGAAALAAVAAGES